MFSSSDAMDFDRIEAPLALCSNAGHAIDGTRMGRDMLVRLGAVRDIPGPLPADLWRSLERVPLGSAVEWRSEHCLDVLGCTRYRSGDAYLLLMNEISDKHVETSRRLHRQRLEATGRLVASIAHDLRNSLANIMYSADYLAVASGDLTPETVRETAEDVVAATRRLQGTVDGLLDYARLGPTVSVPVSIREVLNRAQGFLRAVYHKAEHELTISVAPDADQVRGNSLTIEQILVNLLLNAAEASDTATRVFVSTERSSLPGERELDFIRIRIRDDGPGVPAANHESIFLPFFTTRAEGTGLGLTNAREAAQSLGGHLELEETTSGASFAVYLPRGDRA